MFNQLTLVNIFINYETLVRLAPISLLAPLFHQLLMKKANTLLLYLVYYVVPSPEQQQQLCFPAVRKSPLALIILA